MVFAALAKDLDSGTSIHMAQDLYKSNLGDPMLPSDLCSSRYSGGTYKQGGKTFINIKKS